MKLLMLGSGTSTGVPRIGSDWGECDPGEPKNRRTRVSIIVENQAGQRILVDTSPDLRQQLLANGIARVDAVFWTHDHADHVHGIDDLRVMRYGRSNPLPGYAADETCRRLRRRFDYVFAGQHGYPTIVELDDLSRVRLCAGFSIEHCQMPHGPAQSTAFRFEADGLSIGYATDFDSVTEPMLDLFDGIDLMVCDCLRRDPHPTHAHLEMALQFGKDIGAGKLVLTHLDKSMDYSSLQDEVPVGVLVGYDGMQIEL